MEKRNVLITGGARGIGAATARLFAKEGYRVFVNFVNNVQAASDLSEEIKNNKGEAFIVKADVRDDVQLINMFDNIEKEYGGVDILVSNANMNFVAKPFMAMNWEEFSQKLNDEMHAAFSTAKLAAEHMRKKKFGRLIFISSTLSESPSHSFIAHGTAKGALDSFNKYLAQELGPDGITSNIVAPGLVQTDATKDAPEEFKDIIISHTPTRRIATPDDIANAIFFLAGEHSSHITGTYIPVCGGIYLP